MNKFYLIITIAYMSLLMYASLITEFDPHVEFLVTDLTHVPAYAILTFLIYKSIRHQRASAKVQIVPGVNLSSALVLVCSCALIAIAYGALIEVLQGFTGRQPSWLDVGLNTFGAVVAVFLIILIVIGTIKRC